MERGDGDLGTQIPAVFILEVCSAAARRLHKRTTQAPGTGSCNMHQVALWLLVDGVEMKVEAGGKRASAASADLTDCEAGGPQRCLCPGC